MKKLTIALSAAALALSGAVVAQTAAPAAPDTAPRPDLTRAEVQQRAEARFARMDANRDGKIDAADRAARQAARFDSIDTDHNGSISRAEFEAHHASMRDHAGDKKRRLGAMMHHRGPGAPPAIAGRADGPVTRQAFVDRALSMFDRADANHDGTITQAERKAVRDSLRQQWQARKEARQQG